MPSPVVALDLIKTAMRYGGVIATGETPSAAETADGLQALNDVIERWNIDRMAIYASDVVAFNTVAGINSYTMGPGGTWGSERPLTIMDAYCTLNGVDFVMRSITQEEYNRIGLKTIGTQLVQAYTYINSFPMGQVLLYPTPSAVLSVKLNFTTQLSQVANSAVTLSLPPGYARALAWSMWIELASQYGQEPTAHAVRSAQGSYAAIKRSNHTPNIATFDRALLKTDALTIWLAG